MDSRLVLPPDTLLDGSYRIARIVGSARSIAKSVPPVRQDGRPMRWPAVAAAFVAVLGGAFAAYEYVRRQPDQQSNVLIIAQRAATDQPRGNRDADRQWKEDQARQASEAEVKHRAQEAEEERKAEERQTNVSALKRPNVARIDDNERVAAADRTRRSPEADEKFTADLPRTAAILSDQERATFVKRVQEALRRKSC